MNLTKEELEYELMHKVLCEWRGICAIRYHRFYNDNAEQYERHKKICDALPGAAWRCFVGV